MEVCVVPHRGGPDSLSVFGFMTTKMGRAGSDDCVSQKQLKAADVRSA
jgi:hypothetical protein